jgi:hypothetical protein
MSDDHATALYLQIGLENPDEVNICKQPPDLNKVMIHLAEPDARATRSSLHSRLLPGAINLCHDFMELLWGERIMRN